VATRGRGMRRGGLQAPAGVGDRRVASPYSESPTLSTYSRLVTT
jgi:hypothetical protein